MKTLKIQHYFGIRVRHIRIKRKIKFGDFCDMACITKSTLSKIENGKSNATLETVNQISAALKISPSKLLP